MEAVKYMILGMSVVFAFLYLLTLILELQHRIIQKYFKEPPKSQKPQKNKKEKLKKVAAIAAAIHHQRKRNVN